MCASPIEWLHNFRCLNASDLGNYILYIYIVSAMKASMTWSKFIFDLNENKFDYRIGNEDHSYHQINNGFGFYSSTK